MKRLILIVLITLLLVVASTARAQSGSGASTVLGTGYDLSWSTIDNGGGESSSSYVLAGTIGQPDAGMAMSGGGYTLNGGFWGTGASQHRVYLPVVIK